MRMFRTATLLGLGLAILIPPSGTALAQCATPRIFATSVLGATKQGYRQLFVDPGLAANADQAIGRFWQSSSSLFGNNFTGSCSSIEGPLWWMQNASGLRYIAGDLAAACLANTCTTGAMTLVIEDETVSGEDAVFVAFMVNETPFPLRRWDLANTVPGTGPITLGMPSFPAPSISSALQTGASTLELQVELEDVADGIHATLSNPNTSFPTPATQFLPASAVLESFDLYQHVGDGDPGRSAADWTLLTRIPYEDAAAQATVDVSCPVSPATLYLAAGLSFDGGEGPDVPSALVGRAVPVDCLDGPLIAHAGSDLQFECSSPTGTSVTLDGTQSIGADSFHWTAPEVVFDDPTSVQPTAVFPVGATPVTLTVERDGIESIDTVTVTVADTTPPTVHCSFGEVGGGQSIVTASATDVCCGTLTPSPSLDLGWASIPVAEGMTVSLTCQSDCESISRCGDTLDLHVDQASLVVRATDCSGLAAVCTQTACGGTAGETQEEVGSEDAPGGGEAAFERTPGKRPPHPNQAQGGGR